MVQWTSARVDVGRQNFRTFTCPHGNGTMRLHRSAVWRATLPFIGRTARLI
ncbi:MAG: hypothetical protein AAGH92_02820 [Planctomycetota bacterium]